ncbi:S41 family peptidase [Patescibacteria group bacterium]|nr:S41 family peptidase [Patescibacteria group bacterium]
MESKEHKQKFSTHNVILALVFFVLGYLGYGLLNHIDQSRKGINDFSLFWDVWSIIEDKYPFEEPSSEDKVYGAIEGLVASYHDDYTTFFPPSETAFFSDSIAGEFGGIGAEIGVEDGYLVVVAPLKDSPAEAAGLEPRDIITHIDGTDIDGMTLDGAISLIRGEVGTKVSLMVVRQGEAEPLLITVTRDHVVVPILDTEIFDDTFIIHLYNFNQSSADAFKDAVKELKESGLHRLVIDLRNNPGGFLDASVDMASYFLPQGAVIVREEAGEGGSTTVYRSRGFDILESYDLEIIILINNGSASASEILAGALSENHIATIAGEPSFGKGSVQEYIDLPGGTSLKVTVARWLTPEGRSISDDGIIPEYDVPYQPEDLTDTQLLRTVRLFDRL